MSIPFGLPAATFAAGIISFLSPCVLPMVPGYFSIITGASAAELRSSMSPRRTETLKHALAFVLGFSVVFIALGIVAGTLGTVLAQYQSALETAFGVIV